MKIPENDLVPFLQDLTQQCSHSRAQRLSEYRFWRNWFYSGSADETPATYNKLKPHTEKQSSLIYSPADVRFAIELSQIDTKKFPGWAEAASAHLSDEYHNCGADLEFADAVDASLIKGSAFLAHYWNHEGLAPQVIQPEYVGVLREDKEKLDDQEAILVTHFLTPFDMARRLAKNPERKELIERMKAASSAAAKDDERDDDYFHQIVIGGTQPVATQPPTSQSGGNVAVTGGPVPQMSPDVIAQLIRLEELWVFDDEREDFTTFQYVPPDIVIEGRYKRRNLLCPDVKDSPLKGHHPFVKVSVNKTPGYFWGRSEIADLMMLQDVLNRRLSDVQRIWRLQARQPRAYAGFQGLTEEKSRSMLAPGGWISEANPGAKVQDLAPQLPERTFEQIGELLTFMEDIGGMSNLMQGRGEAGVRAGVHARTLARSGSSRSRTKALRVERQLAESGELSLLMMMDKSKEPLIGSDGKEFLLSQLPADGYRVGVDSHVASPAFAEDYTMLAFELKKAGAIDGIDLIGLTHPPKEDTLTRRAKEREAAQAKLIKEHPELLLKGKGRSI
ncbi:MAG TPA: hypothetical protein VKU84_16580 [Stellaceae bacterium]|nr:hypothetical protein [Stellaceae bacterium]